MPLEIMFAHFIEKILILKIVELGKQYLKRHIFHRRMLGCAISEMISDSSPKSSLKLHFQAFVHTSYEMKKITIQKPNRGYFLDFKCSAFHWHVYVFLSGCLFTLRYLICSYFYFSGKFKRLKSMTERQQTYIYSQATTYIAEYLKVSYVILL